MLISFASISACSETRGACSLSCYASQNAPAEMGTEDKARVVESERTRRNGDSGDYLNETLGG